MSWQAAVLALVALVVVLGFAWYERARPPARMVALVAALAALAVAGRLVLAPVPNVVATTDVALITGYALGGPAGFAVGALAAPISNIWLGQGPWTAWQMAGWGLVGLAGAWLATVSGRRLGRWGLAIACGLAGLAYGALLDLSVMVTYGGEQSLDRYLALSARGLPFNIAHAAGNLTIALLAGPALVRMISRYRSRFAFTWRPAGALPIVLLAALLAAAWAPAPARSSAESAATGAKRGPVAETARWLAREQNSDGGFGATPEYPSNPAMTGWVMLGLEAAGENPLDVRRRGKSPVGFLRSQLERLSSPGDLERTILALEGAGVDPRDFGGLDLVAELRSRRRSDGSVRGQVNLTAFYALAMRAAGVDSSALARPAGWLRASQNRDGGWGFSRGAPSDPDSTGAALQALAAAGAGDGATAAEAKRWLRKAQRGDGGFALATSGVVNSQSTAWAVQGLLAAGDDGKVVRRALDALERLRSGDGHYRYSRSSDQTPVWVTAQVLLAVERRSFPLAAVARAPARSGDAGDAGDAGGSDYTDSGFPADSGSSITPSTYPDYGGGYSDSYSGSSGLGGLGGLGAGGGDSSSGRTSGGGANARGAEARGSEPQPRGADLGTFAERIIAASTEPTAALAPDDDPVTPYVAGGFGLLALALGGGFLWYRRTLP